MHEQGVQFAVVAVKPHVLTGSERGRAQARCREAFPGLPVVLMAQDSNGVPMYHGRDDIVRFVAGVQCERLPWREWTLAA